MRYTPSNSRSGDPNLRVRPAKARETRTARA